MVQPYTFPVDQLLTLGDPPFSAYDWATYTDLGLLPAHIPELIRIVTDEALHQADSDSAEVWAPVHAWRALGQLRAADAVEPLLQLLSGVEDDDWVMNDFSFVFGLIGKGAVGPLASYLADSTNQMWARVSASSGLAEAAENDPDARDDVVAALTRVLKRWHRNAPTLNGFIIADLALLRATEAAPLMEEAFAANRVDLSVNGDWEDIQIELGLLAARETTPTEVYAPPPSNQSFSLDPKPAPGQLHNAQPKPITNSNSKRRMAAPSRKRKRDN